MSELSSQTEKLIGVEVTTSHFRAVCLDTNGNLLDAHQTPMIRGDDTAPQLVEFTNELQTRFGSFDRIGIAVPGLVDRETRRVAFSTYFPEHQEIDLLLELEKVTKLKILIENDANCAAYGEFLLGAGRGSRNLFYVMLGMGVGGALIFDGRIWHGAAGFAGEFGHVAVNSEGMKLEEVASSLNLIRRTRNRFHQDHTSSLGRLPEADITVGVVVREAQKGDDFAQLMLERTGMYVGTAIAGVINLLNIEKIVIGGEIMLAGELVLGAVIRRARELSFTPSFATTEILAGELGENAASMGAALLSKAL